MNLPPKRNRKQQASIPLTPLVDIVFLLLIYFLLTTNFLVEEGIEVNLPRAEAQGPREKTEIVVFVDRGGKTWFAGREVAAGTLLDLLRREIGPAGGRPVVVKADRDVALDAAVRVMDMAQAAGAHRLSLATERRR